MADAVVWRFFGYVTPAGGRDVQDWFDALDEDGQDKLLDVLGYLQHLPVAQWRKPDFFPLGDGLSEVRAKDSVTNKVYRIYGFFWPHGRRYVYTFLLGHNKKVANPKHEIAEARKRLNNVETLGAQVHEFKFSR